MTSLCEAHVITVTDGVSLHVRYYCGGNIDAPTLLIVHGACGHGDRYRQVASQFAQRGWNVISPDLRGHGHSSGTRTHINHFDDYLRDLEAVRSHFNLDLRRTVMLGHSMGALAVTRFAQTTAQPPAAMVLLSPLFRTHATPSKTKLFLGKVVSLFAPKTRFRSDVSVNDASQQDDDLSAPISLQTVQRSVTAGWLFEVKKAIRAVWADAADLQLPTLVLQAGQDHFVDPTAPQEWLATIGSSQQQFHFHADSQHELFDEPNWQETVSTIDRWLCHSIGWRQSEVASQSYREAIPAVI